MKGRIFLLLFLFTLSLQFISAQSLTDYANPLIGTQGVFFYGRTTPFVTPPFGMTHWTPLTRKARIAVPLYNYLDTRIRGFRASHKPAMWMGDYGHVTLKPVIGTINKRRITQTFFFSHVGEVSKPHYYRVHLHTQKPSRIKAEITATERCGVLRFHFPRNETPAVFIEASELPDSLGWIKINPEKREIIGWNKDRQSAHLGPPLPNFKGYFIIKFSEPFESFGVYENKELRKGNTEITANNCGAWVRFVKGTQMVEVRVATSFISIEQAHENFRKEIEGKTWEVVQSETKAEWEKYLSRIELHGATRKQHGIFYSAMYHTLLFPRQFSEYGRYYSAFDDTIHTGVSYNDYSLWDTYRAQHPLLILTAREHVPGMVQSLLQMYEQGGYMPKWPNPTYTGIMIGTHSDAVVADAVVKGITGFDLQKAYEACMKNAMVPSGNDSVNRWADRAPFTFIEARAGLHWVKKLGYVPVDKTNESVSNTLEGAYDDFCVAQVAKAAGKMEDYNLLLQRSKNYINVFNPKTGMMAPRLSNGSWYKKTHAGFTEGGPWTYLFAVQHDVAGLIELLGGKEKFIQTLDANFRGGHYFHTNEPGHHFTYLYNYAGAAWKTQKRVAFNRWFHYHNYPDGMNGDDDCGQMSAWYVFSALGFYPVTPGTNVYAIGTPLFPSATIYFDPDNRENKFEITAKNVSKRNIYIQSAYLNGKKLEQPFLHHSDITGNGKLEFIMGAKPNKKW